jgi:NhaP-type Na+/H+ or K+/H+ antiporter
MALAVAIPLTLTGRELIIELVFGAVLFSLVIQGLALPWLIKTHIPHPQLSQIKKAIKVVHTN